MKKTRILLVDNDMNHLKMLKNCILQEDGLEVVGCECDGINALDKINNILPDIVVLDLVLPRLDGFGIMTNVDKAHAPIFIVTSSLNGDAFVSKAISSGASYYMLKPFNASTLCERIKEFCHVTPSVESKLDDSRIDMLIKKSQHNLDEKLANIFISVGIPAHIKGYQFLREAIKLAIDTPDIINSITKKLYPAIANRFDTSPSKVERAIRHAIEVAWNRGKIENINSLFGIKIYSSHDKPTNGEFIALLADKMIMEGVV